MRRLALSILALAAVACTDQIAGLGPPSDPAKEAFASSLGVDLGAMTKTPDGLYYRDLTYGTGALVVKDTVVTITYTAYLTDGTLFDSGTNSEFDMSSLVSGVREGIVGMRVGGRRQLVVPSALGYGSAGSLPNVPRQATLVYLVNLTAIN
jgi:FKBP-type peptidyl-prolyl cis-trans isomerase FkpA